MRLPSTLRPVLLFAILCACSASPLTAACADGVAAAPVPPAWQAVDAAALDAARGGFELPSGLAVGLGIERMVAVNGELVTQTRFAIADVRTINADQAAMVREAMSSMILVQNGRVTSQAGATPAPANAALSPVLPAPAAAMVVQNSLDNQHIESQTVIDASVNTLNGFKSLNFSSSVLDALARAANQH